MKGKYHFTPSEAEEIRALLVRKIKTSGNDQKPIRQKLRQRLHFYISDFTPSVDGFGPLDFDNLVRCGQIKIIGTDTRLREAAGAPVITAPRHSPIAQRLDVRPEKNKRDDSDEAYVIDLCDKILNQQARRQHRFPFLKGDRGHALPVDAYYPNLNLVIEYRERQHTESVKIFDQRMTVSGVHRGEQRRLYDQRRRDVLPEHGIALLEISYSELTHGRGKRLSRNHVADHQVIANKLKRYIGE